MSGYSGTPLHKKLGIKEGMIIQVIDAPTEYGTFFDELPPNLSLSTKPAQHKDFVHLFVVKAKPIRAALKKLRKTIQPDGMIWVSWPKKASKVETDVTEDVIRDAALAEGLVDVKVCAINDIWSGGRCLS